MRKSIHVPPPKDFENYSPSELFRFFFQLGHWTDDRFSDDLQNFAGGKLVSTVTISKWKNRDVIPTRYSGPILNLVESSVEPELVKAWQLAFETVWAQHSIGKDKQKRNFDETRQSDAICDQHKQWVRHIYQRALPGQTHSAADQYVPIQFYNVNQEPLKALDVQDLASSLIKADADAPDADWVLISGAPGSGKSMAALHLAKILCDEDIFSIYIRCSQLSNIEIDVVHPDQPVIDSFSINSFLKHFRASSFKSACLILDGIESINQRRESDASGLRQLLSNLEIEQSVCAAHQKLFQIVVLGRDSHVEFAAEKLRDADTRQLAMMPMHGRLSDPSVSDVFVGTDLRPLWWRRYLALNDLPPDPSLPDFLCVDYADFSEFGAAPALAHLLCRASFAEGAVAPGADLPHEIVNAFTYKSKKNEIYKKIIDRFVKDESQGVNKVKVMSSLQRLAVSMWHNSENQDEIPDEFDKNDEISSALELLNKDFITRSISPDILLMSPPDRPDTNIVGHDENGISDYLICSAVFDCFQELVRAFGERSQLETALKNWINISRKGSHRAGLASFFQREATSKYQNFADINWDDALLIIKEHQKISAFSGRGVAGLNEVKRSMSLLFFIWSCLNVERQQLSGLHFRLSDGSSFQARDVKSIQMANGLDLNRGTLVEPRLGDQTLLTPSLSALHVFAADLSQLSFGLGETENSIFERCSFAMTHWSHVKIHNVQLKGCSLQQAIFHQVNMRNTDLTNCLFQGASFQGGSFSACVFRDTYFSQCHFAEIEFIKAQFHNVVFDRCVFSKAAFSDIAQEKALQSVKFRHCTFLDMKEAVYDIPTDCLENPIFQHLDVTQPSSAQMLGFEEEMEKFL